MAASTLTAVCFLAALRGNFSALVLPSSPNYTSSVTVYNLNIPVKPAAIVYPSSAEEVAGIVKCAAESGYKVQAKGGGHSYANFGWGGENGEVVVNLANLQQFSYDAATTTAKVGSGSNLGDVTLELHNAGNRSVAHGSCPDVGIGGHATIGGVGTTSRLYGATIDHVVEVKMVIANGSIVTASATQNTDLFFAMRGAGGSFGIVTEFTFKTEPEPTLAVFFSYTFIGTNSTTRAQTFQEWQTFIANPNLPREFSPAMDVLPSTILVDGAYFGTLEEYNALNFESAFTAAHLSNVTIVNDWLALSEIFAVQTATAEIPAYFYAKSLDVKAASLLSAETIEALFTYADTTPSDTTTWLLEIQLVGGAINDVSISATAFPHRDVLYWIFAYAATNGTVTATTYDWVAGINGVITAAQPNVSFAAYAGYVDPKLTDAQQLYWATNLPRLESIKAATDPHDVFHNPQSVPV